MIKKFFLFLYILLSSFLSGEDQLSLGVTWLGESKMAERVTDGTLEILNELTPDLNVEIIPNLPSNSELNKVLDNFSSEKDAIVIMRSNSVNVLSKREFAIPVFFGALNDPVALGLIKNIERPGGNRTGVSYYINIEKFFSIIMQLSPKLQSLLLIHEKHHPGAAVEISNLRKISNQYGIEFINEPVMTDQDVREVIIEHSDSVDGVIFGNQNIFKQMTETIQEISREIVCFSFSPQLVSHGILASLSADDFKLGRILAGSIISVLYQNTKIGDISVKFDKDPIIHLNIPTAEHFGIIVPIHLLRIAEVYQ